jgi:hypothetical protein
MRLYQRAVKFIFVYHCHFRGFSGGPLQSSIAPHVTVLQQILNDQWFSPDGTAAGLWICISLIAFNKIQRHLNGTFAEKQADLRKGLKALVFKNRNPSKTVCKKSRLRFHSGIRTVL